MHFKMFGCINGSYCQICEQMILMNRFFLMNLSRVLRLNQSSDSLNQNKRIISGIGNVKFLICCLKHPYSAH